MDRAIRISAFAVNLAGALFLAALAVALWLQGRDVAGWNLPATTMSDSTRLPLAVAAGLLAALMLVIAIVMIAPRRRRSAMIALNASDGGAVIIPAANVEQTVAEDVSGLQAVSEASARASQEKAGIAVDLAVVLRPDAELPATVDQIAARVDAALVKRYGTTMARKPRIEVRYASAREEKRAEVQSPAPTT